MEELIIQSGVRQGRFAELIRSQGSALSVGRDYSNDLVITDVRVAPKQLEFRHNQEDWMLHVLDDMNPVNVNGKTVSDEMLIQAGDTVSIGHTKLMVYTADYQVAPTKKLLLSNWLSGQSIHPIWPIALLVISCLLLNIIAHLEGSIDLKWKKDAGEALILAVAIVMWAGFWAVVGRVFRHQHHMGLQLIATTIVVFFSEVATHLIEAAFYPFHNLVLDEYTAWGLQFVSSTVLLFFNLTLALNLQHAARVSIAIVFSVFAVLYGFNIFEKSDSFVSQPSYSKRLEPPILDVYDGVSSERYWLEALEKAE